LVGDGTAVTCRAPRCVLGTEDIGLAEPEDVDMSRPAHRHHQGHSPSYAGLHTGRRRNPKAGTLVIHRLGQPDEIITAAAFSKRIHQIARDDPGRAESA
jgi:hypothetical protein